MRWYYELYLGIPYYVFVHSYGKGHEPVTPRIKWSMAS